MRQKRTTVEPPPNHGFKPPSYTLFEDCAVCERLKLVIDSDWTAITWAATQPVIDNHLASHKPGYITPPASPPQLDKLRHICRTCVEIIRAEQPFICACKWWFCSLKHLNKHVQSKSTDVQRHQLYARARTPQYERVADGSWPGSPDTDNTFSLAIHYEHAYQEVEVSEYAYTWYGLPLHVGDEVALPPNWFSRGVLGNSGSFTGTVTSLESNYNGNKSRIIRLVSCPHVT